MNPDILKYLSKVPNRSPRYIDRLLVSAFIQSNGLSVKKNLLIRNYLIQQEQKTPFAELSNFINYLGRIKLDIETLIQLFEFVISPAHRVVNGAIYTPKDIREFIVKKVVTDKEHVSGFKAVDLACGCGSFLLTYSKYLHDHYCFKYADIYRKYIYGTDIESYAVTRSKLLLSLFALLNGEDTQSFKFNLFKANALNFDWRKKLGKKPGFNFVLGNPPYVSSLNISDSSKKLLKKWQVCQIGKPDLYIPFFEIGMENLAQTGSLGFITMNTFFKSLNGRALRDYLSENTYKVKIIDFGTLRCTNKSGQSICLTSQRNDWKKHEKDTEKV